MTDSKHCPKAAARTLAGVETISDYYRRRAEEERQCADGTIDRDLRRIHLQRAEWMGRLAEEARLKS